MKIKILGTKGEIKASAKLYSKQSGILIDNKLLFDIGELDYLKFHPKAIFITHLHSDHACFMRPHSKSIKFDGVIYGPETNPKIKITQLSKPIKIDDHIIIPIPTLHSQHFLSQGYIIEKNNKRIFYSSDLIDIKPAFKNKLSKLDLVITEASFIRKGGLIKKDIKTGKRYGHSGIPNLVSFFSKRTNKILLTHFGSWFYRDIESSKQKIKNIGEQGNIKILIAFDGMELEI